MEDTVSSENDVTRFSRARLENFRAIRRLDIEIRPLTVVIGPNGVGKTSLLEALRLISGAKGGANFLSSNISRLGGYDATLSWYADTLLMKFGVAIAGSGYSIDYDLLLEGERGSYFVKRERLVNSGQTILERSDQLVSTPADPQQSAGIGHGQELAVHHFGGRLKHAQPFIQACERVLLLQCFRFQPIDRVRSPQHLQPTPLPSNDGTDLFSALYTLQTEQPDRYADLLDTIRGAIPEFEDLSFPLAGAGHVNLTWKQSNFTKRLYAPQLSDGQLRWLWLMTVLHSVPDEGLLLIDEPELSLHPQWLLLLVSILRSTSARTTIVVATQSVELVKWVEPEELVVADLTDEGSTFSWASDHPNIDKWLKDFSLSELWTMGELGGRR